MAAWESALRAGWQEAGDRDFPLVRDALLAVHPTFDWGPAIRETIAAHQANFGSLWTTWSNVGAIVNEISVRAGKLPPISNDAVLADQARLNAQHAEENKPDGGGLLGSIISAGSKVAGVLLPGIGGTIASVGGGLLGKALAGGSSSSSTAATRYQAQPLNVAPQPSQPSQSLPVLAVIAAALFFLS